MTQISQKYNRRLQKFNKNRLLSNNFITGIIYVLQAMYESRNFLYYIGIYRIPKTALRNA